MARQERMKYERKSKALEEWLMQKKIKEASKLIHLRDIENREEYERELAKER